MAKTGYKLPEEFLMKISKLGEKTDEVCEKVLKAGAEEVKSKVASNLKSVIGKGTKYKSESTGELQQSLGVSPMQVDKDGILNVHVGFSEPRTDGEVNAKIANVLEYGKSGQPPKPFLKPAKTASRKSCIKAMESAFEKEVEKL